MAVIRPVHLISIKKNRFKLRLGVNRNTFINKVMDLLEKAIITGKFLPGERLSEAGLAKQLGVS